jgi:hypothetical protein
MLSVGVDKVPRMRTLRSSITGRYQANCERGLCALTGSQATSKLQGEIFTLLDYVLGSGKCDVQTWAGARQLRIDMVFALRDGWMLAVEYDGAYWHRGKEERDWHKARMIESRW